MKILETSSIKEHSLQQEYQTPIEEIEEIEEKLTFTTIIHFNPSQILTLKD